MRRGRGWLGGDEGKEADTRIRGPHTPTALGVGPDTRGSPNSHVAGSRRPCRHADVTSLYCD